MEEWNNLIATANKSEYKEDFYKSYDFLLEQRIKMTKKNLSALIGLQEEKIDEISVIEAAQKINSISEKLGESFRFGQTYEDIEKMLRLTVLEDIGKEFKKQQNQGS